MNRWDNYTDTLGELCHSEMFHAVRRIGGHDTSDLDKSYNRIKNNKTKQMNAAANERSFEMGNDKRREEMDKHLREYAKKRMSEWVNGPKYFGSFESKLLGPYDVPEREANEILTKIYNEIEAEEANNSAKGKWYRVYNKDVYDEILKDVADRAQKRAEALKQAGKAATKENHHSGTGTMNAHGRDITDMQSKKEYARNSRIARRKGKRW